MKLVLNRGLALVGVGLIVGVGNALGATRLIQQQLFNVEATDPVTFVAVAGPVDAARASGICDQCFRNTAISAQQPVEVFTIPGTQLLSCSLVQGFLNALFQMINYFSKSGTKCLFFPGVRLL